TSPISFPNSNRFYVNQQKTTLHPPKPRFQLAANGHQNINYRSQQSHKTQDFSHLNIQKSDQGLSQTSIPFSAAMPMTRTNS
ncbi:unnamed protein product, partial [Rotaria magnacalcarata]